MKIEIKASYLLDKRYEVINRAADLFVENNTVHRKDLVSLTLVKNIKERELTEDDQDLLTSIKFWVKKRKFEDSRGGEIIIADDLECFLHQFDKDSW